MDSSEKDVFTYDASRLISDDNQGLLNPFSAWENDASELQFHVDNLLLPSKYSDKFSFTTKFWISLPEAVLSWFDIEPEDKRYFVNALHSIASSGFLLDDFQDDNLYRNGQPTALVLYKPTWMISSLLFTILQIIDVNPFKERVKQHVTRVVLWKSIFFTYIGQALEVAYPDGPPITMLQYKLFSITKFAHIVTVPALIGKAVASKYHPHVFGVAALLCYYATVSNEYAALFSDKYKSKKLKAAEDITLGLYSYAVLKALETPDKELFLAILRQRTTNEALLAFVVQRMEQRGVAAMMQAECDQIAQALFRELRALPKNELFESLLYGLGVKADVGVGVEY